ncbi:MAG TPA: mechanosensitive ion channel domain-containing protein [Nitrospirota bacterium]|nr:mechanosensitive ion channel domain-containing protein [Nitrospirota bacterium]
MIHFALKNICKPMNDIVRSLAIRRIVSASLVSAVLLLWPLFVSGQQFPQLATQKAKEPTASSLIGLLGTDADIDKEIDRIKAQVDKLLAESLGAGVASGNAPVLGASPDEVGKQERVKSELVIDLDKQIDTLKELKEIRKDNASYERERKTWKGFAEKPPFPIAFLDDIRDSLLSQRLALQSFELRLSLARALFKRFDDALKKSRKALRLAQEASSRSVGTPREQGSRWLLDLAQLQNDRNETGLVLAELQSLAYETAVKGKRLQIAFLEEKLRIAEATSLLSKEDVEKKLSELDGQRRDMEEGLLRAQKSESERRKKLDAIRDVLSSLPASGQEMALSQGPVKKMIQTLAPARERKLSPAEQLQLLRLDFEAEQVFVETSRLKVTAFKARIQFVNAAEKVWQDRYWLTQKRDLKEIREKQAEVTEDLARLGLVRKFADSNLSSWMNLIKSQKYRIASLRKSDPAAKIQELILRAYEERQDITLGLIEGLGSLERLIIGLSGELSRRIDEASFTSRVKERYHIAYAFIKAIWNTELYVATETTVVEERSIVRPVSVTIGKVVQALIILFIGTWIAGRIGKVIQWALTTRLQWATSSAEPVGKLAFGVMFIGVSVVSLVTVNIPLAVFAFLGGALAIGLGFGAQHLINNFISSLILLFGRSVRVGDIVEVDGQGGRVTNIGMRNSRIRRFDGIDMLVPNSQFIQHTVTNWTLSDLMMRYSVSLSVAYGSPTRETELLIRKAIEGNPMVLKDPPPTVLFEEFGDGALLFTGYFWIELISNRDNRIAVSEIRHEINELLDKAGIVIAFPQRDVHVDSSKPLEVKVIASEAQTKE